MLTLTRTGRHRERDELSDEAGMTLVEIMVASAISLILLSLMTTMVTVFGKAEVSTVNSANAAASVRLTLLQLQHDIQSANPLGTFSTVAAYNNKLKLTIQPSNTLITWRYTPTAVTIGSYNYAAMTLTRQIGNTQPVVELTSVTNGTVLPVLPVFSYYDHCAINQVTQSGASPSSISSATTVVQITLSVANLNSAPYGTTTRVNIMNLPPGASRCG
jgi:prepilin-type N-terminal cleavage/methylation domain-containing protein